MKQSRQKPYEIALQLAQDALKQADVIERCARSGAVYDQGEGMVVVPFVDRMVRIRWPEGTFAGPEEVPIRDRILVLHYLNRATGVPLSERMITFKELPGVEPYLPVFRARTIDRVARSFGEQPELLVEAAQAIGGHQVEYGDVGVVVPALPKVGITFILWRGDEEFAPSGNVLFDAAISEYLPTEDIIVLTEVVVGRLCKVRPA